MTKGKTKDNIIKRLHTERRRLEKNLVPLTPKQMLQSNVAGKYSIKDILAHLAEWESFMPDWVEASRRGEIIEEPNWEKIDEINERIFQKHKDKSLDEVLTYFHEIHKKFMEMVETMPDNEMLTPKRYNFLGGGAIWDWLNSYAAHDLWGKRKIRKWLKEQSA